MRTSTAFKITFLAFLGFTASAQKIYTLAGNGNQGYSGDGGPAFSSQLNSPIGVAIDPSGNIYVSDTQNHRIRKITPSGIITTFAGTGTAGFSGDGGPASLARINQPCGIALDTAGTVFFADRFNHRIRKIDKLGNINTVAGSTTTAGFSGDGGPALSAKLSSPGSVAVDRAGNIYIADTNNDRIRKVGKNDTITTVVGGGTLTSENITATSAALATPWDVAVDTSGNIYLTDSNNNRVRKVNSGGLINTIAGTGVYGFAGDGGNATSAQLKAPYGVELDGLGNIYISDSYNYRVRKINTLGKISTVAGSAAQGYGGDGGLATLAALNIPTSVAIDAIGDLYIADDGNHRIRKTCQSNCLAGVENLNAFFDPISISPNPNNGSFIVNTGFVKSKFILVNSIGQIVFEQEIVGGENAIQTKDLPQGLYHYILFQNEMQKSSGKIVIE